jgi:cyclohexanecarboxylate-CoA ligase
MTGKRVFEALEPRLGARRLAGDSWRGSFVDGYVLTAASEDPGGKAIVDVDDVLSYAEAELAINSIASGLRRLGVGHGDVVSWQLPNWHEAYLLHHAILRIGAVSNPLVPIYRQREVEYILAQAASRVVVVPATFRGFDYPAMICQLRGSLPALEHVVVVRSEPGYAGLTFEALRSERPVIRRAERSTDDPILLMFTSGTTSRPKGVLHTHNTLDCENRSIIQVYGLTGTDVVFMPSPVSHISGMLYGLHLPPMLKAPVVLQDVWDPEVALDLVVSHRCSFTLAATPFLHGLTYHPKLEEFDVSSMRVFACGGADVPAGLIRDARSRLGCLATRVYGSTEFPTLSTSGPDDPQDKAADTDGRRIGSADFRLEADDGTVVAPGEAGEIVLTGPELFLGYLREEDNQGSFTDDGWFRTGDLGSVDDDGYLTIQGRNKDIILRGGENISASEVEGLLFEHPAITEVAIVAMPDPVLTERACAFVVLRPDTRLTIEDVAAYLEDLGVAKQKIPERLEVVGELPKTLSGKVQKFRLRDEIRERLVAERAAPV